MTTFNEAVKQLENVYAPSTIYSIVYCLFIPIGHAITSLTVFGWPKPYLPSLLSNAPIGLTAMCIGTFSTAYLDDISFNEKFESFLYNNFASIMGQRDNDEEGEFYSSFVVTMITGLWSFVLAMLVNSPSKKAKSGKGSKEL